MHLALSESQVLQWSQHRPSLPGFYWLRYLPQDRDLKAADVVCVEPGGRVTHMYDDGGPLRLDNEIFDDAVWAGPLAPPA
ncbi:MAG: hypothetical protein ACYTGN_08320 [Planctomycetota bacterium]|jgi:hypothetical protein